MTKIPKTKRRKYGMNETQVNQLNEKNWNNEWRWSSYLKIACTKRRYLLGKHNIVITYKSRVHLAFRRSGKICLYFANLCSHWLKYLQKNKIYFVLSYAGRQLNGLKLGFLNYFVAKGQKISKQNCRAADSPKKTNEGICFSTLTTVRSFVFWENLRLNNFVSRYSDLQEFTWPKL